MSIRKRLRVHSLRAHLIAPVWVRIPEKHRWTIVHWLDRSRRRCWAGLVDDALARAEDDPCDTHFPSLRGNDGSHCASTCYFMHSAHVGTHPCSCYCGKFQFVANDGAIDRKAVI